MKQPKIALAMIVKGSDAEARVLDRCLETASAYVDGIFLTRTQPNAAIARVAKKYKAVLSDFEWCDDFAAARNFNFAQVPKDYTHILWCDADDVWRGLDKLKSTLNEHAHHEAFGLEYLYDWDADKKPTIVHWKTQIVRNDGCVKWVGTVHEDLEPQRQLDVIRLKGIERLHLSTPERHAESAERNLRIARRDVDINPDDPRSHWNLANALLGSAKYMDAADAFTTFIRTSQSKDEKYLAWCRLADIHRSMGKTDEAIKSLQLAIGLIPTFPDAYFQLGYINLIAGNLDDAEQYTLNGLKLRPPVHRMIVYNPRDYDYNPMMQLAKIYYQKNRPDLMLPLLKGCLKIYPNDQSLKRFIADGEQEMKSLARALRNVDKLQSITDKKKLKAALDKLPTDIASHPAIATIRNQNFIKTESSGRDLVIYCGRTPHQWSPIGTGFVGGSEEAVLNLSDGLSRLGWRVTVYNNCGHKPINTNGVTFRPYWEWNYRDKQDVVIVWRNPYFLKADINAPKIYLDLHDVIPQGELTPDRLAKLTKIFVKSSFHRSLLPDIPDDKFSVIPNGIDVSLLNGRIKKDPWLMINTSSPDRSMDVLPKLFTKIKKHKPKARLVWAYGWETFKNAHANDSAKMSWMRETQKQMDDAGIETVGRLSQEDIGKLYQQASILAYPTEFAEIDCISVRKAQAAGCFPITTDFAALNESVEWGIKIHSQKDATNWSKPFQFHFGLDDESAQQEWVDACIATVGHIESTHPTMGQFSWERIAQRWNDVIS